MHHAPRRPDLPRLILMTALLAVPAGAAAPDGDVEWDGIFADTTRQFVQPSKVETGQPLTLSLRAWADDLTGATCTIYYVGPEQSVDVPMVREAGEGPFDWWRCRIDAVPDGAREVYYRFSVTDGDDTDYYDAGTPDDDWPVRGMQDEERAFFDFRLYVGLDTPAWSQGASFYQVFPDRFFDGAPDNNRLFPEDCHWYLDFAPATPDAPECAGLMVPPTPDGWKRCDVVEDWNALPNGGPCDYFGGDLPGVEQKLPYLDDLGVDAVYLNPVFRAPSNHKYDTMTYEEVDPRFGGTGSLDALTRAVHARDLKIIVDGVFNHVSEFGEHYNGWGNYARDAGSGAITGIDAYPGTCGAWEVAFAGDASGCDASAYADWFRIWTGVDQYDVDLDGDRDEAASHTCGWAGLEFMPEIDYRPPAEADSGPRLWLYGGSAATDPATARLSLAGKWLADGVKMEEGLDGWRLDVPDNAGYFEGDGLCPKVATDPTIWQGFRDAVKAVGEDKYISGEIWGDASDSGGLAGDWFRQRTYDAVMNYYYFAVPVSCLLTGYGVHADPAECENAFAAMVPGQGGAIDAFDRHMAQQRRVYPAAVYLANQNLLSSHDSARFASRVDGDHRRHRLGMFMQAALPGAPMIYYGDEVGHGEDATPAEATNERGRATMPWHVFDDAEAEPAVTREHQRTLLCLRREISALRVGSFLTLHTHNIDATYAFARFDERGPVVAAISNADGARRVSFSIRQLGLPSDAALVDALTGDELRATNHEIDVDLGPYGAVLLMPSPDAGRIADCRQRNRAPNADAGEGGELMTGAVIALDGGNSSDPDGAVLTYRWTDEAGAVVGDRAAIELPGRGDGTYTFTLTVDDGVYRATDAVTFIIGTGEGPDPEPDMGPDPEDDMGPDPEDDMGPDPEDDMGPGPDTEPDGGTPEPEADMGEAGDGGTTGCALAAPSGRTPWWPLALLVVPALRLRRRR